MPDVKGVRLGNAFDTTTNSSGYAALTYLNNYTRNEISIDPSTLPDGALLLENTNRVVYPTSGAIVKVKYPVRFGRQALFHLYNNGTPLPFGTEIKLLGEDGQVDPHVQGLVGESGRVFLTALPANGRLQAVLADATTVEFSYKLSDEPQPETNGNLNVERLNLDAAGPGAARKVEIEPARGIESREEAASDRDVLPAELVRSYGQGRFCFLLKDRAGQPLPAGTIVISKDGGREVVGSIDPAGRLFMSNIPSHPKSKETLTSWIAKGAKLLKAPDQQGLFS